MGMFGMGFGAAAGAGLGVAKAGIQNKRIAATAQLNMKRINEKITQMRVNKISEMGSLSREVRQALGDMSNSADSNQAVTETLASRLVANAARDQDTIDMNLERGEAAADAEKVDIASDASAATVNPIMAGLEGAMQGAGAGASLGGAISGAMQDVQINSIAKEQGMSNVDIAKTRSNARSMRVGGAKEAFNLVKATNSRITSKIQRSSVRRSFDSVHSRPPAR